MNPKVYYNDNCPKSCAWLRELIAAGQIPDGVVDERSILDVQPADLAGFVQCHFFAGIGGWSLALKLAGWREDKQIWTGSAPCQPYSAAGQGKGDADERNLWPAFFRLIKAGKPQCVIGEQVEAAIRHGWLDGVCADLEGEGYTCGAAVLGAHSVGAPHIRQRLYWVAHAKCDAGESWRFADQSSEGAGTRAAGPSGESGRSGLHGRLANASGKRRQQVSRGTPGDEAANGSARRDWSESNGDNIIASDGENCAGRLAHTNGGESGDGELQRGGRQLQQPQDETTGGVEHAARDGREQRRAASGERGVECGCTSVGMGDAEINGVGSLDWKSEPGDGLQIKDRRSGLSGFWENSELIPCADGKARRIESGTFPLAHGVPGRVGLLRGYGNAIVPQVAAEFIKAVMDCC